MTATVRYKTYDLAFNEGTEEWTCGDLALANKSLAGLKKAIDGESKKRRRVDIDVLYLHEGYRRGRWYPEIKPAKIVLLREGDRKADIKMVGASSQEQVEFNSLYPLSARKKLERFIAAEKKVTEAEQARDALKEETEPLALTATCVREMVAKRAEEAA
jgi:hypothetical protein